MTFRRRMMLEPDAVVEPPAAAYAFPGDTFSTEFDEVPSGAEGSVSEADLELATGSLEFSSGLGDIATGADSGEAYLRKRYVPNSAGSTATAWRRDLGVSGAGAELWMSYDWMFGDGAGSSFDWGGATAGTTGGKMPGLAGGLHSNGSTGGGGGGQDASEGWSSRLMWRDKGTPGNLELYAYHPDKPGTFGDQHDLHVEWGVNSSIYAAPEGQRIRIIQRVKLNSDGATADGEIDIWIDELQGAGPVLRYSSTSFRWWAVASAAEFDFLYSTFHGGATSDWSPAANTFSRIYRIDASTTALHPGVAA